MNLPREKLFLTFVS